MLASCPDSYENLANCKVVTEAAPILFTGNIKEENNQLRVEAQNCAVLDCACSSTVCGQQWMTRYLESLNSEDQTKVTVSDGIKVFKFGGGETLKSLASYKIPAVIADKDVIIYIPLLLSLDAMKKAKIKLISKMIQLKSMVNT